MAVNGYLATVVWFLIAGYLLFTAIRRERKPILFILSGFMVFLGVWELINVLNDVDMKAGVYGWIYRGVAAVVLVVCLIWFFMSRRRS
ncbi:MAG: hypothetical protein IJI50_02720 [Ruminococcus sp.]|nr:hypothetical protein [Ruminococcus sp.]